MVGGGGPARTGGGAPYRRAGWLDWTRHPTAAARPPPTCPPAMQGPKPLLLSTVTHDDLAILLSWSDQATSQVCTHLGTACQRGLVRSGISHARRAAAPGHVRHGSSLRLPIGMGSTVGRPCDCRHVAPWPQVEFGAHQVVLVRSMDSAERLPEGLRDSNALVLTVPQVGLARRGWRSHAAGWLAQALVWACAGAGVHFCAGCCLLPHLTHIPPPHRTPHHATPAVQGPRV